ncbi:MAG: hypothetical protein J5905_05360 [Prevotella sp.]|nr:hypothetical protein [Prevotella sp.]
MDSNLVNITELSDSLSQVIPIIRSIEEHSAPAPFTYINIIISLIAAFCGFGSFLYAKKTADNVSRLSRKTQIDLCEDLLRDSLQIVVRLLVALKRIGKDSWVITEEAMKDLNYWPSEIYFKQDVYNSQSKIYKMIYNLKRRMQDYNNKILDCQQKISRGEKIDEEKLAELYENNWVNLYKAYAIYEKLNKKIKYGAVREKIRDMYIVLHITYDKNLKSRKEPISLDMDRKRTYIEKIVELYNSHKRDDGPWSDIYAIEKSIIEELSHDAALFEETMRIKERKQLVK